ncbi:ORF MSV140 hypothetical protein [Melanoplus sanguinipes entomopoxvirus]|uniref:Uncharacterized protein n=1 Tax=Melanoplus sanguinipes entomopoxvirus TaxID=83191 RepID=Q9YVV2_MSEPV|nr:ORF MSV140 hypothetical protein [Melanoplus sanguinipes entomopoxvirus]AAC97872.1 ORF MSV140 hypothetical protein [Melanoplus sanguinipes entomopoxvirus 'O']
MDNIKKKQNIYGITIFDYNNILNYNDDKVIKHMIENKRIDDQDVYINNISKLIYSKINDTKESFNNKINFNLLYSRDKYINGFQSLQIFNIYTFDFNENFLYVDISLPSLIMLYNLLYNEKPVNKNFNYYVQYQSDYLDKLLVEFHNAPNSSSPILNKILYLRSFPIFNYIMEKISNNYLNDNNRHLLDKEYENDINNPAFTKNITFLNLLYFDNIEYYTYNIKNLMNNNTNILSYLINIPSNINYSEIKNIIENEYNVDIIYQNASFDENYLKLHIIKNEFLNITNIIDTDLYFESNRLYNLNRILLDNIKDFEIDIISEIGNYNNDILNSLYIKGLYRFYHELLPLCLKFYIDGYSISHESYKFNYNYDEDENISYTINNIPLIKNINNNKIKFINETFNNIPSNISYNKIFFTNLFSENIFKFKNKYISMMFCSHFILINELPTLTFKYIKNDNNDIYSILNSNNIMKKNHMATEITRYIYDNFNKNNNRYDKLLNIVKDCVSKNKLLFPLLLLYIKNDIAIDILILFYENDNILKELTETYDKFINTINFVSYLNNNINKSLTTFLLFSNDKVRVRYNIIDSFTKLFSSLYNPKYDIILSLNSL